MDRRHDRATAPIILRGRVLRPLNVGVEVPGRGMLTLDASGEAVHIVVLADRAALDFVRREGESGTRRAPPHSVRCGLA
jgi:calcineurin-like phosphoesterase